MMIRKMTKPLSGRKETMKEVVMTLAREVKGRGVRGRKRVVQFELPEILTIGEAA